MGASDGGNTVMGVVSSVRISEVYQAVTGVSPRRTGRDTWRAKRPGGDSPDRISGDDSRGIWHDFVDDSGGGVLDLIVHLAGGSRQDALRWLADFAGLPLQGKPLSREERQQWARERQELDQHLPNAQFWRRAAVNLIEAALHELKTALFDPMLPQPKVNEIYDTERVLARLKRIDGAELVAEYREWAADQLHTTAYMVDRAKKQERVERAALLEFLGITEHTA
jgi:hypothetical protein